YSTDNVTWTQVGTTQTIAMSTTPLGGYAVTSHNTGIVNTATFENPPPTLASTIVNGGTPELQNLPAEFADQRSMVNSIKLTFSTPVVLFPGPVTISIHPNPLVPSPTLPGSIVVTSATGGFSTDWIVTFTGANVVGNSIADGEYDLDINPSL